MKLCKVETTMQLLTLNLRHFLVYSGNLCGLHWQYPSKMAIEITNIVMSVLPNHISQQNTTK